MRLSENQPGRTPGLSALFAELGRDGFLRAHWPDRPCVAHGAIGRLNGLAELAVFEDPRRLAELAASSIKAIETRGDEYRESIIQRSEVSDRFDRGCTIAVHSLQHAVPLLEDTLARLESELGVAHGLGNANLYLSPPEHGLSRHFDDHEVLIVQLAGTKRWCIAVNDTVRFPTRNFVPGCGPEAELAWYRSGPWPDEMPAPSQEVELSAGSVLFVPRGYWHETRAGGRSLSFTLGFNVPGWHEVIADAIRVHLARTEAWREPAWGAWGTPEQRAASEARLRTLLGGLTGAIGDLSAPQCLAYYPHHEAASRLAAGELRLERRFRRRPGVRVELARATSGGASLVVEDAEQIAEIDLPPDLTTVMHRIAGERDSFTLGEVRAAARAGAPNMAATRGLADVLQLLVEAGLLEEAR